MLIDNYDSFTYNLVHYFENEKAMVTVVKNDDINLNDFKKYDAFVLSPGPGMPVESGDLLLAINEILLLNKPILGVCLGFQAILEKFNGKLFNQPKVKHGVSEICVKTNYNSTLLANVAENFEVGLYHSWAADKNNFPENLKITSISKNGIIMSFEDDKKLIFGVQFHPESVLTPDGKKMIQNFIAAIKP